MNKLMLTLVIVGLLSGCSAVSAVSTSVNYYCGLAPEVRSVNREAISLAIAPNKIKVDCSKDG